MDCWSAVIRWIDSCNIFQPELVRSDELLDDSLTMKEVSQIYGLYAKVRRVFVFLHVTIFPCFCLFVFSDVLKLLTFLSDLGIQNY